MFILKNKNDKDGCYYFENVLCDSIISSNKKDQARKFKTLEKAQQYKMKYDYFLKDFKIILYKEEN